MSEEHLDDLLEELAEFVHGSLFTLHTLGVLYNVRKKNYFDVTMHTVSAVYDLYATIKHHKNRRENDE